MIKLCFEDKTLNDIDENLLPFVQWKSLKVSDFENVNSEIISKYIFELARPVMKSLIKAGRVNLSGIDDATWLTLADEAYYDGYNLFEIFQLPYSAIANILNNTNACNRHASNMAATQVNMPVADAIKHMSTYKISQALLKNSNPALIDFVFSDEGIAIMKTKRINDLRYLTTSEAKKLGFETKNRTISPEILRRAGACGNGISYCTKMMKELGVTSIKWDDAILTIRNNPKYQTRSALLEYMEWIYSRSSYLPE